MNAEIHCICYKGKEGVDNYKIENTPVKPEQLKGAAKKYYVDNNEYLTNSEYIKESNKNDENEVKG